MDYSKIIDLDNVTIEDCERLHKHRSKNIILNDGRIVNLEDMEDKNEF